MILGQPLVAHLTVAEEILDHMKRVFHLGTDAGLGFLDRQQQRFHRAVVHRLDVAALGGNAALEILGNFLFVKMLPHAGVTRVAVYALVIFPDPSAGHGDIGDVGRRRNDTMGQSSDGIDADMGLQAEVPLVAPLGLLHLRIALLSLFFGRRGCRHDSRVVEGAFTHEQALLSQVGVDLLENPLGQRMLLQQVTEAQECGRVRYAFARQIDTHEVAHRLTIVDRIFERLVGDRIPLLQEVDPQHALQADVRTAAFARYVREVG